MGFSRYAYIKYVHYKNSVAIYTDFDMFSPASDLQITKLIKTWSICFQFKKEDAMN